MTAVLDRFEAVVDPIWPALRAQVVHGDLTSDNALVDDHGEISGIVDFGDMSHTALVTDIASMLDSICAGRTGDEMFRAARLLWNRVQRACGLTPSGSSGHSAAMAVSGSASSSDRSDSVAVSRRRRVSASEI